MKKYSIGLLLLLGTGFAARAQVIRGHVRDAVTLRPLAGAAVALVGTPQQTAADSGGHFRFTAVAAGRYLSLIHI